MAEVIWSEPALAEFDVILAYIGLDKPAAARAVAASIFRATDRLGALPKLGRLIPEFPHQHYRQLWCRPCWVYYRIERGKVIILHVKRAELPFRLESLFGRH